MKFNKRISKSILILFAVIASTIVQVTYLSLYNGTIDNANADDNQDFFEKHKDNDFYPHISSNTPPNANYFKFYKIITIDHDKVIGTGSHTNFTLLVSIFDADLKSKVQSNGNDIAFSNGTEWLDHEIESFEQNYNPRYARLVAWVRIPTLYTDIDTVIYMYYGNSTMSSRENPTAVWVDYEAVYHMNQDPDSSQFIYDSTANGYDLTPGPGFTSGDLVDGSFGKAIDFDGDLGQYLDLSSGFVNPANNIRLEIFIKPQLLSTAQYYFRANSTSDNRPGLRQVSDNYIETSHETENGVDWERTYDVVVSDTNTYHHIVDEWVGGTIGDEEIFVDGILQGNDYGDPELKGTAISWDGFTIGSSFSPYYYSRADAVIEEFRISSIVRGDNWVATEYKNLISPSSFYSVSGRIELDPLKPEEFNFYKKITMNHNNVSGTNDLIDFPLMISILDADLRDKVQSDGDDIAFWNGSEWLHHEIEYFSKNYNAYYAKLVAWIRIPILHWDKDTDIYMYYGNPTMTSRQNPSGVWNYDYEAVWHLDESSGTGAYIQDSSSLYHDGTPTGTQFLSTGKIDGARDFVGNGDNEIDMVRGSDILNGRLNDHFSFSFWIYPNYVSDTEWQNYGERLVFDKSTSVRLARIRYQSPGTGAFQADIDWVTHATSYRWVTIYRQQWNYITYTYDGTFLSTYVNGQPYGTPETIGSDRLVTDSSSFRLGCHNTFKGYLDEFRVMKESRSGDFIETEYNNQHNPTDFYNVSRAYKAHVPSGDDFEYFKRIIDQNKVAGNDNLIDFPVLISILDSDLKSHAQSDGDDILFSNDSEGIVWFEHEIERYNPNYDGNNAQLIAWIRVPILYTSEDTEIYMHYGNSTMQSLENPSGVWDNGYKGIYHLKGNPTQELLDSTSHNNYGTSGGSMTSDDQVSAKINGGIDLDGSDDYFTVADSLETESNPRMTISAWIFLKDASDDWITVAQRTDSGGSWFDWQIYARASDASPSYRAVYRAGGSDATSNITLQTLKWYYLVARNNGTHNFFYLDGYLTGISGAISISDSNNDIWFGGNSVWGEYLQGIMDEVRVSNLARSSDWILTEYRNQNNPSSFYSVGPEMTGFANIQVNAIDLYNRPIPSVNISITNNTKVLQSKIADMDGSVSFSNFPQAKYNFSATITSNIHPYQIETINQTSEAIEIDSPLYNIYLICNISRNIFYLEDLDGKPLESGWIVVRHNTLYSSQDLQNCTIDTTGKATFRWLNTSGYHYTVWYQDNNYNPNKIILTSGEILNQDSQIDLKVNLTTVNFTVKTSDTDELISGVKLLFSNTSSGDSVVNLTTGFDGFVSFRWLNTSNFYNYSLTLRFYGYTPNFEIIELATGPVSSYNFSVQTAIAYVIKMQIQGELEDYETKIESLNPKNSIVIECGLNLTLRTLFNVTKVPTGSSIPLGPTYADSMSYEIYLESTLVTSGYFTIEEAYIGRYLCTIGTYSLQTDTLYNIIIKAYKSEYVVPDDLQVSLYLKKNNLILNQSENDDSIQTVYWSEIPEMSVKSYTETSEELIIEDNIYYNDGGGNYDFQFSIPDLSTDWNLSQIVFNIYGVTFGEDEQNINLNITGPYGIKYEWYETNASYYYPPGDTGNGAWYDLIITLNKESPTNDNNFNFTIEGTFVGTVQINAEAIFRRNIITAEYYKSNITDTISIPSDDNGWVIKNITFEIINCYNLTGNPVDPTVCIDNITTNEGYVINVDSGKITIDDKLIYPLDNQFLFTIGNNTAIIFDVRIKIEYIQEFYKNNYLEVISYSKTVTNFAKGNFSIGLTEEDLNDQGAILDITNLKIGSNSIYPSGVAMNITILGQTFDISDKSKTGGGTFILENIMGFTKNTVYTAIIRANQQVNFTLSFMITYSRTVVNEIEGIVTYEIEGTNIGDTVQYDQNLALYSQNINTSLLFARYEPYTIKFRVTKDSYNPAEKQLTLKVLERLTLISGSSSNLDLYPVIYVQDELIFAFSYTDQQYLTNIIDLETQRYTMTKISAGGQSVPYGTGDLYINSDNEYVLDINTESVVVGRYTIWVTLDKQNYESKQAIIFLTINEREIEYNLGDMFEDKQTSVVKGETITLSIELTDPTNGDVPLTGATVILEIGDDEFEFEEVEDGVYELEFETDEYEAFFTSNTITGTIKISKANYTSEDIDITIVIEMEEIEVIPGILRLPIFYLLLLIAAIGAVVGSLGTYKYIQLMKIPEFVKRLRSMKKLMKTNDNIDNSLLYPSKEMYIAHLVKDKWDMIGVSLEAMLGMEIQKVEEVVKVKQKIITTKRSSDLIPKGLILMRWNERVGTEIVVQYPEGIEITKKTLMQIYSTHEYTGESGVVTLMAGNSNILSYYTGPEKGYYLVLILNLDDDPDVYEDAMVDILRIIFQNLEGDSYLHIISSLFQRLSMFPNLTAEGRIAYLYQDEIKRMIITRLREEGVIIKSELMVWLKDKYKESFFDLENILTELIKMEIIKGSSIKGLPSELIFLINDIYMIRVPPIELLKNAETHGLPSQLIKRYSNEINKFFQNYRPTEEDIIKVIETITDPQVYEALRLIRTAIVTKNDLEKLKKKGVSDINLVLKQLWQANLITVLQDKTGTEYYALLSDFDLDLIFPKYLMKIIKMEYDQKSKGNNVLIEYLNILEDTYMNIKSKEKSEK
ncbi:MAG: DUF2341 domain-containing protein [Candidatus Hodarchaeota archaeon]